MKRLYFGVVSIREGNTTHNRFFSGLWGSTKDALADMKKNAREEWPDGPITNAVAYPVGNDLVRELTDVELFDVSVVTYPAYPETTVAVRSIDVGGGGSAQKRSIFVMRRRKRLTNIVAVMITGMYSGLLSTGGVCCKKIPSRIRLPPVDASSATTSTPAKS